MSTETNVRLFERAAEVIDYFDGKLPAQLIENDLKANDLESLAKHVKQAEDIIFQNEFEPDESLAQ